MDDVAFDIGEAAWDAVVIEGEAFVIEAEEMEEGGVEVVERVDVFDRTASEFVRFSVTGAAFDAGTGHPAGETVGVVIATLGAFLEHRHAAELRAPHHERVLEHPALGEIADEGGGGLVKDGSVTVVLCLQFVVSIPVEFAAAGVGSIEELNEPNASFKQASREDAVLGKAGFVEVVGLVCAVHA